MIRRNFQTAGQVIRHASHFGPGPCRQIVSIQQRRPYIHDAVLTVLKPPAIFTGLVLSLWAYKCLMMVLFQNKIIYMPSVPPFARGEKLKDYVTSCFSVVWQEERITSLDGTRLSLCVSNGLQAAGCGHKSTINVLYFQG